MKKSKPNRAARKKLKKLKKLKTSGGGDHMKKKKKVSTRCGFNAPNDLMFEVFLRLPVKTLTKFQCVSKSWYSLISDSCFRESHHNRSKQNPILLECQRLPSYRDDRPMPPFRFSTYDKDGILVKKFDKKFPSKEPFDRYGLEVLFTCLDLVCLVNDPGLVFLLNPTTKELMTLPLHSPNIPSCSPVRTGFGYLPFTKEFKVLQVIYEYRPGHFVPNCICEVFTLGTDCWRVVENPPFLVTNITTSVDGVIYLLSIEADRIASFDLNREEWGQIEPPVVSSVAPPLVVDLRELRGYLCAIGFDHIYTKLMEFWLLKDRDKGEWVKDCTIDLSDPLNGQPSLKQLKQLVVPLPITPEADDRNTLVPRPRIFTSTKTVDQIVGRYKMDKFSTSLYVESFSVLEKQVAICKNTRKRKAYNGISFF